MHKEVISPLQVQHCRRTGLSNMNHGELAWHSVMDSIDTKGAHMVGGGRGLQNGGAKARDEHAGLLALRQQRALHGR